MQIPANERRGRLEGLLYVMTRDGWEAQKYARVSVVARLSRLGMGGLS